MQNAKLNERGAAFFKEGNTDAGFLKIGHSLESVGLKPDIIVRDSRVTAESQISFGAPMGARLSWEETSVGSAESLVATLPFKPALRIGLSGVMGVGKDHVANNLDCTKFGFADPMYRIAEEMLGTSDKSVPGVRKFLQTLGAWGRGDLTEDCPWTMERALFVERMRHNGSPRFGEDAGYWVRQCLTLINTSGESRIAVPNVRFANEANTLRTNGFKLVHVTARLYTIHQRRNKLGYLDGATFTNVSEQMALDFDRRFWADEALPEGVTVYWNDDSPRPTIKNNTYYNT